MRSEKKTLACLCLLAAALAGPDARADTPPSVWDRARDPKASSAWATHLELQRRMRAVDSLDGRALAMMRRPDVGEGLRTELVTRAEEARKAHPQDVPLRFDEGAILEGAMRHAQAKRVLEAVLAEHPDHPMADDGRWSLAQACGHLGDHPCERRAYTVLLQHVTEDAKRTLMLLNAAETEMHLDNLKGSLEMYRECIRVSTHTDQRRTMLLAQWGLAVAYDRAGDGVAALREASLATDLERSGGQARFYPLVVSFSLREPGTYFVPAYELDWYEGLGATALAKKADNDLMRLAFWRRAEKSYASYVAGAEADTTGLQRWIPIAKNRLAFATAERIKFEKKVKANPSEAPRIEETL